MKWVASRDFVEQYAGRRIDLGREGFGEDLKMGESALWTREGEEVRCQSVPFVNITRTRFPSTVGMANEEETGKEKRERRTDNNK